MDSPSPEFEAHQKILEGHRALKDLLARVEEALAEKTASIAEVSALLGRLGDQLVKHFELEEAGGYFAEALEHAPRLISRANDLMNQHPKMTARARELAEAADPEQAPDAWWQQTAERFKAFQEELLKHERNEDGLIQEVYHRDLGEND